MKVELITEFDFSDGVDIPQETINEWIDKILNYFKWYRDNYYLISSGNSFVVGMRDEDGYIEMKIVTTGYKSLTYQITE